jgi:hypothetical protein
MLSLYMRTLSVSLIYGDINFMIKCGLRISRCRSLMPGGSVTSLLYVLLYLIFHLVPLWEVHATF